MGWREAVGAAASGWREAGPTEAASGWREAGPMEAGPMEAASEWREAGPMEAASEWREAGPVEGEARRGKAVATAVGLRVAGLVLQSVVSLLCLVACVAGLFLALLVGEATCRQGVISTQGYMPSK